MIVLGRIAAPYGVKGWVRVEPHADDPGAWAAARQWWLAPRADLAEAQWQVHVVESARWAGGKLDVKLSGMDDRTAAEGFKGWFVALPRDAMPRNAEGEYYWGDLVGMRVVNRAGAVLGTVAALIETGANDVLVVREGETERLIPFIASVIDGVDLQGGVVNAAWEADW